MIRQTDKELEERLAAKTLDQALVTELQNGFNYSPFESRAILEVVKTTYLTPGCATDALEPGQMIVMAIQADEPPGKPLEDCQFKPIVVTVHTAEDDQLRRGTGRQAVSQVRKAQIERMAWEAVAQETHLTVEDLAYRILNCGVRTIEADLAGLRADGHEIPLRGQQMDIGRGVTHEVHAVRLFLERKSYTEIQRRINHSPKAIQRYIESFVAVAVMTTAGLDVREISFLRHISLTLVQEYQKLYDTYNTEVYRERLAEVIAQFRTTVALSGREKGGRRP